MNAIASPFTLIESHFRPATMLVDIWEIWQQSSPDADPVLVRKYDTEHEARAYHNAYCRVHPFPSISGQRLHHDLEVRKVIGARQRKIWDAKLTDPKCTAAATVREARDALAATDPDGRFHRIDRTLAKAQADIDRVYTSVLAERLALEKVIGEQRALLRHLSAQHERLAADLERCREECQHYGADFSRAEGEAALDSNNDLPF